MNTTAPTVQPVGLALVRVAILFATFVVVGATACGIFDRLEWVLVLAPTLPALSTLVFIRRGAGARVVAALTSTAATCALATVIVGGSPADVADALTSGFQGLLSTEWPSPRRADLIGTVALAIAAATALSTALATRRRFHLLPLVPLYATYLAALALSAPRGVRWPSVICLGVLSITFALLRNEGALRDRFVLLRGELRLAPLLLIVAAIAAILAVPVSLTARADPRRSDPPAQTAPILDPIEATLALRGLDPEMDLHIVTSSDGGPLPRRWRTAALSDYDGDRWTPELTLRPIGRTLGTASGPTVTADISFLDDDLSLVPLPGPPITVDADVETDAERTVVRLVNRPEVGDIVPIVAGLDPAIGDAPPSVVARLVDDDVSSLSGLAQALAGDGTPIEQLDQLESAMRNDFVLDNDVQGGGLQRAFIELFLRDTQRGNTEQFVTSFVLLARSLGHDARVATGFVTPSNGSNASGELSLRSADATIWPEVRMSDGTWLAWDPVPPDEATDLAPPPPEPQTQTPAAPQPPVPPPPEPDAETTAPEEPATSVTPSTWATTITWGLRGAAGLTLFLLPFAIVAGLILGAKYRRRRRRLGAANATDRIRGAWATATDALVDAGMSIGAATTDGQIADDGEPLVVDASRDLHRLATLSSAATYGSPAHVDLLATDAKRCLDAVEQAIVARRTRRQRLRWRLSLRSLRPATRSPVTG